MTGRVPECRFLLDTHIVLWALERPEVLSRPAHHAVTTGPNVLSVVSYWEVMVKSMKGTLDVGDPRVWWQETLDQLAATPLPVRAEHIAAIHGLAPIHQDPFDRMLIAQATVEGLMLVTADAQIGRYAAKNLRVIK